MEKIYVTYNVFQSRVFVNDGKALLNDNIVQVE